jgi:hypothetical protein
MTAKELDNAFTILDWSNREAGKYLGITDRTIHNYMKGKRAIPLSIEKFVKLHLKHKRAIAILSLD